MMNFRVVSAAIISVLGAVAAGNFKVVGYRTQKVDAEELRGNNRRVQCYYDSGDFPKSKGRNTGPTQHEMTFNLDLSVSAAAKVDLSVIHNPAATTGQIATALAAMQDAAYLADIQMDELIEFVYQTMMDPTNYDLGLGKGVMSSRWVGSARKDDPQPMGSLMVLTARVQYTCQTVEAITGETGTLMTGGVDTILDIDGDDTEKTGVLV